MRRRSAIASTGSNLANRRRTAMLVRSPSPSPQEASTVREVTSIRDMASRRYAAAISDAYFETIEQDLERRMVAALRSAGVTIRSMSKTDYIAWLELAQRTAWVEYTRINPRAQELLVKTVRTFLARLGDKDTLVDAIFGEDQKN